MTSNDGTGSRRLIYADMTFWMTGSIAGILEASCVVAFRDIVKLIKYRRILLPQIDYIRPTGLTISDMYEHSGLG